MISRRQFLLTTISAVAAVTIPTVARAMPLVGQTRFPMEAGEDKSLMPDDQDSDLWTTIKVIGVGGGGCAMVEHMIAGGAKGIEFICADTDTQALSRSAAHKTVRLGPTGLGAGGKPEQAREVAELVVDDIRAAIEGAHMLLVVAGVGGCVGTGAVPVIARMAREMGIVTVGVVTTPCESEGALRMANADGGLSDLGANVNSLIVVPNEKLLKMLGGNATLDVAFAHANDVLKTAVVGIADTINEQGLADIDFEDVRTVMEEPGRAKIGTAVAAGPDRARIAAERAMACPLLDGIDLSAAGGLLVLVSAAYGTLRLGECKLAMNTIRAHASSTAHVIYGTFHGDDLGNQIRVTVIATGVNSEA